MATLTQLEYIVTVDRMGHFGRAAQFCHVSQPSLSMQIQKVEEEMGLIIFDRIKKPIKTTERGKVFVEQAKVVLRESRKLESMIKEENTVLSGEFRLGIIPTLAPYLLPYMIEPFSRAYPKVILKIDELKTEIIINELKEDILDGGILVTPLHGSGLVEKPLFYEKFYLYLGREHELFHRKRIKEEELDGSDMWLLQDGHCLRNQVVKICSIKNEKGVYRNIQFEGGNLETLRYLVKKSRGTTLIPQLFVNTLPETEQEMFVKEFEPPVPNRQVSLVYRRDQWKLGILQALEKVILENLPSNISKDLNRRKSHVIKI
ncbi:MAG: hydrogen peroxide-inducible genes activator [Bdellovibrionales bacterium]|nr:hydrogen peroxide-inducible genes activator [Bdellovibrionales bacterium]